MYRNDDIITILARVILVPFFSLKIVIIKLQVKDTNK